MSHARRVRAWLLKGVAYAWCAQLNPCPNANSGSPV
jgi:hypothetical protein